MTVDGVHCLANEPLHDVFSMDKRCCSHTKTHTGFCCELGIDLHDSKLIWMNGPFPAGPNDKANFVNKGLKSKLAEVGKKAPGNKICNGCPNECSTFNAFDSDAAKAFESHAQMRHEQFNGMLKEFDSMDRRFCHGEERFETCFEAICVVCQHRMENGEPPFDLLAGVEL